MSYLNDASFIVTDQKAGIALAVMKGRRAWLGEYIWKGVRQLEKNLY